MSSEQLSAGKADWKKDIKDSALPGLEAVIGLTNAVSDFIPVAGDAFEGLLWIVEAANGHRRFKKEYKEFSQHVKSFTCSLAERIKQFGANIPPEVSKDMENINGVVSGIKKDMEALEQRHWLPKLLQIKEEPQLLLDFKDRLNDAMTNFMTLHMISQTRRLLSIQVDSARIIRQLDTLVEANSPQSTSPLQVNLDFSQILPPSLLNIFGRSHYITCIVEAIQSSGQGNGQKSANLVIMGPAGIGKTSVALSVLHDVSIKSRFEEHVYFVSCEAILTTSGLIARVSNCLGIKLGKGNVAIQFASAIRAYEEPCILCLDNFETCWDVDAPVQRQMQIILELLAYSSSITLLVTMRGSADLPGLGKISWHPLAPLDILDEVAARETFLSIAPDFGGTVESEEHLQTLNSLLKLVDYVPLAITLLARRCQTGMGETPESLYHMWLAEQKGLLELDSGTKQDNMDISIRLSLSSKPMQDYPMARRLLTLLSLLPDGALIDDLRQQSLCAIPQAELEQSMWVVQKVALAFPDNNHRLRTLAPIRQYINMYETPNAQDLSTLVGHYCRKLINAEHAINTIALPAVKQVMLPEMGNISNVFARLLAQADGAALNEELAYGIINYTRYRMATSIPNAELLERLLSTNAMTNSELSQLVKAKALYQLGEVEYLIDNYVVAEPLLLRARDGFTVADDLCGVALCLKRVGDIRGIQDRFNEAEPVLKEARAVFLSCGEQLEATHALRSLGVVYRVQDKFDEALPMFLKAKHDYEQLGNLRGASQACKSIGDTLLSQGDLAGAKDHFKQGSDGLKTIGDRLGMGQCMRGYGVVLMKEGDYTGAQEAMEEAYKAFRSVNDKNDSGWSMWFLAKLMRAKGDSASAKEYLRKGIEYWEQAGLKMRIEMCNDEFTDMERQDAAALL